LERVGGYVPEGVAAVARALVAILVESRAPGTPAPPPTELGWLAALVPERDRLAAELERATRECAELRQANAALGEKRATEREHSAASLLEAQTQAARAQERSEAIERVRRRLEDEVREADVRVARLEQELAVTVERGAAERLETLRRALETTERTET